MNIEYVRKHNGRKSWDRNHVNKPEPVFVLLSGSVICLGVGAAL